MKTFSATITLSDENHAAMQARASGMTDAQMANSIVTEWCEPYAKADETAEKEAVTSNDELMAVNLKAMDATPEKRTAAIAAFDAALASPPSR